MSFGYYINFDFNVYNECLSIASYPPPSNYNMWLFSTDPDSFKYFEYKIEKGALPVTYKLPRLDA